MTTAKPATLTSALVAAQAAAHSVEKDARNTFHRYAYVSAEAMIADSKQMLADFGLGLVPIALLLLPNPGVQAEVRTKNGAELFSCAGLLSATWRVIHGPSGEMMEISMEWPVVPEAGRPLDKAVAAARTASLSYLLRDLLQLPRVEEGTGLDDDQRDRPHAPAPVVAPPPKPKTAPTHGPTTEQAAEIKGLLTQLGITENRGAYLDGIRNGAESVQDFDAILDALRFRVARKEISIKKDGAA